MATPIVMASPRVTEVKDPAVTSSGGGGGGETGEVNAANSATSAATLVQRVQPLDAAGAVINTSTTGLATEATLATKASEATLATRASEATLATRNLETTQQSVLTALNTIAGAVVAAAASATLFNAVTSVGAGSSTDIGSRTQITVQNIITGTVSVLIQGSLNNTNWITIGTSTGSEALTFNGPYRYIRAYYASGTGTVTTLAYTTRL